MRYLVIIIISSYLSVFSQNQECILISNCAYDSTMLFKSSLEKIENDTLAVFKIFIEQRSSNYFKKEISIYPRGKIKVVKTFLSNGILHSQDTVLFIQGIDTMNLSIGSNSIQNSCYSNSMAHIYAEVIIFEKESQSLLQLIDPYNKLRVMKDYPFLFKSYWLVINTLADSHLDNW